MTINSLIEKMSLSHPDEIPSSIKYRWLGEFDRKKYLYPEDGDTELAIKSPHENIYELYIVAMSDFFSGNLRKYEDSAQKFKIEYEKLFSEIALVTGYKIDNSNTCVSCGETIPEGRLVCFDCENS